MENSRYKFRAWELDTAIIRYGSYVIEDGYYGDNGSPDYNRPVTRYKICEDGYYCEVAPDTVGQYTGLKDKNGVEIYESDLLDFNRTIHGEVKFVNGCFIMSNEDEEWRKSLAELIINDFGNAVEVIGNIYEDKDKLR